MFCDISNEHQTYQYSADVPKMLGNVGKFKNNINDEVKTTIEHIGLYVGLMIYTSLGAAVKF